MGRSQKVKIKCEDSLPMCEDCKADTPWNPSPSFGCAKKKLDEYTFTENFYMLIKEFNRK